MATKSKSENKRRSGEKMEFSEQYRIWQETSNCKFMTIFPATNISGAQLTLTAKRCSILLLEQSHQPGTIPVCVGVFEGLLGTAKIPRAGARFKKPGPCPCLDLHPDLDNSGDFRKHVLFRHILRDLHFQNFLFPVPLYDHVNSLPKVVHDDGLEILN